jgi:uncharacterized circularly permuted ATP-grasp superfamily protein/uncharacterized alpha-E superfamily protein
MSDGHGQRGGLGPEAGRLFSGGPSREVYREQCDARGELKPHWARLLGMVAGLSETERMRRMESARGIISEQGITYNVYGDDRGMERPWELDPLPMLLGASEWREIEAGLIQRATLLNEIIADCYGGQRLLRSGDLPPALLYGQRDFLRPLCGTRPRGGRFLNFYAADIARGADGRWWVISDRTQIPTGSGYALANRLVTSRVLPEAFRDGNVERLAVFFRRMREALSAMSPRSGSEARVVILTPGPYNETYFEQAYLARYLGYTLVEGQDLIVDSGRVFLKTLSGLEPVDVIFRRVDDGFCDPLELRSDSILGVPGMVEALRSGTVSVANMLGTGIMQSPAVSSFLPGLCQRVLGEDLHMPSRATWWCGQEAARRHVLEHLDDLVGRRGSKEERLRAAIGFAPHDFVGQERMQMSQVPCWEGNGFVDRPVVLRVYLCGTPDGYVAMPGGLARTGAGAAESGVSMQEGGASKDVWVLGDGPVEEATLLLGVGADVELRRVGNNLPSRLADNFFWLGRYNERLDGAARLLRATLLRFSPDVGGSGLRQLMPMMRTMELRDQMPVGSARLDRSTEALEGDFLEAIHGVARSCSLRVLAERLVHLAMLVRDRTSNDVWRVLSHLERELAVEVSTWSVGDVIGVLNRVLILVSAFKGMARENMTRSQGWRFLDLGQRLERALAVSGFLTETLTSVDAEHPSVLESVLEVADSTITYRSRYNLLPNLVAVYDLILLDETNPRSLLFQLLQMQKHVERLPRPAQRVLLGEDEKVLLEAITRVRLLDPRELAAHRGALMDSEVARTLAMVGKALPQMSEILSAGYFSHSRISAL